MFTIKTEPFGKFSQVKLINTATGEYVALIPDYGACLNSLVLKKNDRLYDLIDGSENFEQLMEVGTPYYKGMVLFPFPNRIKDGKYTFEGQSYQFETNESANNNALHGLVAHSKFTVKKFESNDDCAVLELIHHESGVNKAYPFKCSLAITYILSSKSELICKAFVKNEDTKNLPVGVGWHPYFKAVGKMDTMEMHIPTEDMLEVDARMNPTGTILKGHPFIAGNLIGEAKLDTGFKFSGEDGIQTTVLTDSQNEISVKVWQQTGKNKLNYCQYYIPAHRKSIAIEPMSCPADAFNSGSGLIVLAPSEHAEFDFGVVLG